jgi:hypothetical protein
LNGGIGKDFHKGFAAMEEGIVAGGGAVLLTAGRFDARTGRYVDMIEAGILDPTRVVRLALQHAASIVSEPPARYGSADGTLIMLILMFKFLIVPCHATIIALLA